MTTHASSVPEGRAALTDAVELTERVLLLARQIAHIWERLRRPGGLEQPRRDDLTAVSRLLGELVEAVIESDRADELLAVAFGRANGAALDIYLADGEVAGVEVIRPVYKKDRN